MIEIRSPFDAGVVQVCVAVGDAVAAGAIVAIVEAMKMEHEVRVESACVVRAVRVVAGEAVHAGDVLLLADAAASGSTIGDPGAPAAAALDGADGSPPPALRADLLESDTRHALTPDASRPDAVARRHALGLRTARENVADLCDAGSFVEHGALAIAAQRSRRSLDDLRRRTPADGMVTGIGRINGAAFGTARSRAVVLAYDATVLAGTQGFRNHQKTDRMLGIAAAERLPVVLFAEGGGGRPGDVDLPIVAGLHVPTFASFASLSGRVPLVGIAAGRCFAGNAALLGCCDVIVATEASTIGLGGPAMVEGGGLGRFRPEEIGPSGALAGAGVIDVVVADEAAAVGVARRALSMAQGSLPPAAADEAHAGALRQAVPANRQRAYDVRRVLHGVFDRDTLLELGASHGASVVTALARLEGRPVGVLASNPMHLGGAVDAAAAQKATRFLELCGAWHLPLVSFIDTPGFMVGPESEAAGHVRHAGRLFIAAAKRRVPLVAVVLRKAYGLGAMALAGGSLHAPLATASWPSGEFGAMGLEGAVDLGYRQELDAAGAGREALRERLIAEQYEKGKAIALAETLEIDAVIDPAQTRSWVAGVLPAALQ